MSNEIRTVSLLAAGGAALLFGLGRYGMGDTPGKAADDKAAKHGKDEHKFIRLTRDAHGDPQAMETCIVHYVPAKEGDRPGLSVDLIGAVHVGEKSYYDQLNKAFEKYDALLFELVAD